MNVFRLLVLFILGFSLLTFVVLFGHVPSLKRTPVGWLHGLLMFSIPSILASVDEKLTGRRLTRALSRKKEELINERHPIVLIMYLVLFIGGVTIFLTRGVFLELSYVHWIAVPILIALPLISLYLAASTDPGYIEAHNHAHYMSKYRFDNVIFRRGHDCTTCKREKP